MDRVLHKHLSKYQQDCRSALRMSFMSLSSVSLLSQIVLAGIRGQRLKNTPASRFCQEPRSILERHRMCKAGWSSLRIRYSGREIANLASMQKHKPILAVTREHWIFLCNQITSLPSPMWCPQQCLLLWMKHLNSTELHEWRWSLRKRGGENCGMGHMLQRDGTVAGCCFSCHQLVGPMVLSALGGWRGVGELLATTEQDTALLGALRSHQERGQ